MLDRQTIERTKQGILIVNISRGGLISQNDLEESLANGHIGGAALDVYDIEPLPHTSPLRQYKNVILGTHNASNTRQAVIRASRMAFLKLHSLMREKLME
jgi:D-3-phosphoglycerate dehydrogenase